jgi:acetoacetate decarboxylase
MPQKLSNSSTLSKKSQSAMHLNDDERVTNGEKVWGLPKKKKKKLAIMLENVSERK